MNIIRTDDSGTRVVIRSTPKIGAMSLMMKLAHEYANNLPNNPLVQSGGVDENGCRSIKVVMPPYTIATFSEQES